MLEDKEDKECITNIVLSILKFSYLGYCIYDHIMKQICNIYLMYFSFYYLFNLMYILSGMKDNDQLIV